MVAMDVAAEKATLLPRLGSASRKLSVHASQTARIGDLRFTSTLWKKAGIAPSRLEIVK